jgi:ATP-binding cassette subfamily B protein
MGSLTKLFQLLSYLPKIVLNKGMNIGIELSTFDIEFRAVSFHYPKSPSLILNRINLLIKSGEFIGVVGSSGSGKSSLLKVLLRLYDPTEGELLLNQVNINQYSISSYHGIIGYVGQ